MSDFINSITDDDIEKLGLKIIRKSSNVNASFIQMCDSERIFDDKTYTCHYGILHMKKDFREHKKTISMLNFILKK